MKTLYSTPPTDKIFNHLKLKAKELWRTYDNRFGYVDEKIAILDKLQNCKNNFMYIVAMFDLSNQALLAKKLNRETREAIRLRMLDAKYPSIYIRF